MIIKTLLNYTVMSFLIMKKYKRLSEQRPGLRNVNIWDAAFKAGDDLA